MFACLLISITATIIITRTARWRGCAPEITALREIQPADAKSLSGLFICAQEESDEYGTRLRQNGRPCPRHRARRFQWGSLDGGIYESSSDAAYLAGRVCDFL